MNSHHTDDRGASELIGVLMLIAVFVTAIAVVGVMYLSQPIPQKIPSVAMRITNESNNIVIFNNGGDFIPVGKFTIWVDGVDVTPQIQNTDPLGNWAIGDVITYTKSGSLPADVKVIYTGLGASSIVIADKMLGLVDSPSPTGTYYTITASTSSSGGFIIPNGTFVVPSGSGMTFSITPAAGYQILDVLDGSSQGAVSSYTLSGISGSHTITASFTTIPVNQYTIDASAGPGGNIAPNGTVSAGFGENKIFTITPNPGYLIAEVIVNGTPVIPVPSSYTFTNVTTNHTISALFTSNFSPGIVANYYLGQSWSVPAATNVASRIHFADAASGYASDVSNWPNDYISRTDNFSVNFTGYIKIDTAASYTFYLTSDDGSSLKIGSTTLDNGITPKTDHSPAMVQMTLNLTPGYYPLTVLMYENGGGAVAYLEYSSPTIPRTFAVPLYHTPITPPTVSFTGIPLSGNAPLTVQFTDTSLDATTWKWDFGDGSPVSYVENPSHTYSAVGTYNVSLVAANSFGVNTATKNNYVTVGYYLPGMNAYYYRGQTWTDLAGTRVDNEIRYADAAGQLQGDPSDEATWPIPMVGRDDDFSVTWDGYLLVTAADTYTFSLRSDDGSWLWIDEGLLIDNSGLHSATTVTGTIALQPGYHHIVVKMYENTGQAVARLQYSSPTMPLQQVTNLWHVTQILPAPVASFTGSPLSGTVPLTVIFTDSSTYTPSSWLWNFGDGDSTNATVQSPVHTYTKSGTYTVNLTATNAAGSNTFTRTGYVIVSPIIRTITSTDSAGGIINPNGTVSVNQGSNQTFTITPNPGKNIATVLVDGSSVGSVSSYTFMNVSANHTISATFGTNAPTFVSIVPLSGPTAGGTVVSITGTNFTSANAVTFGGTGATSFTVINATSITATTPAHTAGMVDVVITTPGGTTTGSSVYAYVAAPAVTSVSPNAGPLNGGPTVTINGNNLANATAVKFGTATATILTNTAGSITVTPPTGTAGTVDITVTTAGGVSATSSADLYTYTTVITAIGPITGTPQVGNVLTAGALTPPGATATYQWQRSAIAGGTYTAISGATSATYIPVAGDGGYYIQVAATGTGSYSGTVTSAYVGPVTIIPTIQTFNTVGTFTSTVPQGATSVQYCVVGGGGGGGRYGGGGGAGGFRTGTLTGLAGSYTVTVGAGGAGATTNIQGSSGDISVFSSITSAGGGGGGTSGGTRTGVAGGSGGGGVRSGNAGGTGNTPVVAPSQGNNGGAGNTNGGTNYLGGGGGGAGGSGVAATGAIAGNGGAGSTCTINGVMYAGGGGGGSYAAGSRGTASAGGGNGGDGAAGTAGTANTGGGGGGGGSGPSSGGNGGSGIVILRYS